MLTCSRRGTRISEAEVYQIVGRVRMPGCPAAERGREYSAVPRSGYRMLFCWKNRRVRGLPNNAVEFRASILQPRDGRSCVRGQEGPELRNILLLLVRWAGIARYHPKRSEKMQINDYG